LNLLGQYIFSKSMDDTSGFASLPANNYNLGPEYGRADYDRRHRLNLIGTYRFRRGFRAGTVVNLSSGIPFNITTGLLNNGDLVPTARPPGVGRNTGNGPSNATVDLHFAKRFVFHAAAGPSKALPASTDADSSEGRAYQLEFSIDAFNLLNHTNFKNYVGTLTSPFFGRATAANPPRQLQLSTRFHF
jgi:hypothetical protein